MRDRHNPHRLIHWSLPTLALVGVVLFSQSLRATELEGYTEPIRTIEVASDETGTVAEVLVQQGT